MLTGEQPETFEYDEGFLRNLERDLVFLEGAGVEKYQLLKLIRVLRPRLRVRGAQRGGVAVSIDSG
jgi:hypothetical protein